jgi:hypothetical protein
MKQKALNPTQSLSFDHLEHLARQRTWLLKPHPIGNKAINLKASRRRSAGALNARRCDPERHVAASTALPEP